MGWLGIALWRCQAIGVETGRDDLNVRLDGPLTVVVDETARFTATHLDAIGVHGHALFINGQQIVSASTSRHFDWTP